MGVLRVSVWKWSARFRPRACENGSPLEVRVG